MTMDDDYSDLPRKRSDAIRLGASKYITGRPCKRGHVVPRWTHNNMCVGCHRLYSAAWVAGRRREEPTT